MNYLLEVKAFYDWLEINPLPSPAIALWHGLMHIANKTGWQQEFTVAISVLSVKTGLNAKAIERARNTLSQNGRISWKKRGGNQAATYQINPLCDKIAYENVARCVAQVSHTPSHNVSDKVSLLNKHKQNIKKDTNVSTEKIDYQEIIDLYNSICISFSKVTTLSGARKKAIKARYANYKYDEFKSLFEMAEQSDFLKGRNNRDWKANFDWMIKDSNMAKILDGNYANRRGKGGRQDDPGSNVKPDTSGLIQQAINAGYGDGEWEGF